MIRLIHFRNEWVQQKINQTIFRDQTEPSRPASLLVRQHLPLMNREEILLSLLAIGAITFLMSLGLLLAEKLGCT